jgi:diguanylate cyclase (GGDEF)-like protein
VLFIDIDRFKPFNDDHGHAAGDLALQTVARTLHGAMRPFDVIGRWGGDEFVGLFPNVTTTTLTAIAGRLTMLVRTSRMNTTDGPLAVSVSIGGAVSRPADAADSLLRRADVALYASKKAGRGRCSVDGGEAAET